MSAELITLASDALQGVRIEDSPVESLSMRELQILIAIGSGLRPQEASAKYGIAVKTFSTYRSRVLDKLSLQSNAELAILAYELKLVPGILTRYIEEKANECRSATKNSNA